MVVEVSWAGMLAWWGGDGEEGRVSAGQGGAGVQLCPASHALPPRCRLQRVVREVVHRPVEKEYEVVTRAVGERNLDQHVEVCGGKGGAAAARGVDAAVGCCC